MIEVEGEYDFQEKAELPPVGEYQSQRTGTPIPIDPDRLWAKAGAGPIVTHNKRWTLIQCLKPISQAEKIELINAGM